jgi:hypothetical protein
MIAYRFHLLQCSLVTDDRGALILVSAGRTRDFPQKPVSGESVETPMVKPNFHLLARVPRRRATPSPRPASRWATSIT